MNKLRQLELLIAVLLLYFAFAIGYGTACADPIKIQYQYNGAVSTGWLEYINYSSANKQIETGAGFGFSQEVMQYPAEPSIGHSFSMTSNDVAFLFGANWIGVNVQTLKYNEGLFQSQTFRVNHIGFRRVNGSEVIFFDLGDL
jgi:hypothetical protein